MTFSHPMVLLLLVVPLFLSIWGWRRHGQPVVMPFDHAGPRRRRMAIFWLRLAHSLPAVLLALGICILAGPRRWGMPQDKRVMTNIEFVVDVSGSMMSKFGDGNRYDAAMASILDFIGYRDGDSFGLIVFGDSILEWVPLTSDPSALKCAPEFLNPMKLPRWFSQGTSIGAALEHTIKVMNAREEGDKTIILLTDGYSFDLSGGNDERLGAKLRDAGIQVFLVHIAEEPPGAEVTTIASMTGGQVFAAGDPGALKAVFQRIDEMKKARIEKISAETQDDYRPWTLAAAAVALGYAFSLFGLRFVPW